MPKHSSSMAAHARSVRPDDRSGEQGVEVAEPGGDRVLHRARSERERDAPERINPLFGARAIWRTCLRRQPGLVSPGT